MPAFLVGTYSPDGTPNIMTAAWGGICCSEPPCLAVSIRKARLSYDAVMQRMAFTICIPSRNLMEATDCAGIVSGHKGNKFELLGLTPVRSELVDAPYVAECPIVLELKCIHTLDLGSHTQFIGEILDVKANENCLDAAGAPILEKVDPLLYDTVGRSYNPIGAPLGKAYSAGKTLARNRDK